MHGRTLHAHSPDGSTFLREVMSWPPYWNGDIKSKIRFNRCVFTWRTFPPNFIPIRFETTKPYRHFEELAPTRRWVAMSSVTHYTTSTLVPSLYGWLKVLQMAHRPVHPACSPSKSSMFSIYSFVSLILSYLYFVLFITCVSIVIVLHFV